MSAVLSFDDPGRLDPEALARLQALDPDGSQGLLARLAELFEAALPAQVQGLVGAGAAGDLDTLRHHAHTLKSSSASLGAAVLSAACAALEHQAREGRREGLDLALARLLEALDRIRPAVAALRGPAA